MKPLIGLTPLYDINFESLWMLNAYMEAVNDFGAIPCILPLESDKRGFEKIAKSFDGFIFTGGPDLDPIYYGEAVHEKCGKIVKLRDEFEMGLLPYIINEDIPFLGICRGIQLLNVHLGGSLYQDLPSQFKSSINHEQEKPYEELTHKIVVESDLDALGIHNSKEFKVCTLHHQAIKDLGKGLVAFSKSPDGIIEAVYREESKFCLGVQWHPEYIYKISSESANIFKAFIKACKK